MKKEKDFTTKFVSNIFSSELDFLRYYRRGLRWSYLSDKMKLVYHIISMRWSFSDILNCGQRKAWKSVTDYYNKRVVSEKRKYYRIKGKSYRSIKYANYLYRFNGKTYYMRKGLPKALRMKSSPIYRRLLKSVRPIYFLRYNWVYPLYSQQQIDLLRFFKRKILKINLLKRLELEEEYHKRLQMLWNIEEVLDG